jgi:hypothetical protein
LKIENKKKSLFLHFEKKMKGKLSAFAKKLQEKERRDKKIFFNLFTFLL